jgi:starch synthase
MIVLSVTSEVFPLVKTGGLADVAGALPGALQRQGVSVVTLVPGYPAVMAALEEGVEVQSFPKLFGGKARLLRGRAKGLDILALDAPHLFNRPGNPYLGPDGKDWPDNSRRYAALSQVAAGVARVGAGFSPAVVHAHDWQAGLVPAYLRYGGGPPAVMTVHNLAFQGHFSAAAFADLDLPADAFSIDGVEYYGGVGYLKAGLSCADVITTVSPTYAREILTPSFGMGLDGLLKARSDVLYGIVNGIDTEVWNPASDPHLALTYGAGTLKKRTANRRMVEERFGLTGGGIIFCVVSRLTGQKGMDLLATAIPDLVEEGARFAILGSGDKQLEDSLRGTAIANDGRVGLITAYDEPLSHLMQGGSDAILVPSRFEPCGLTQLYGLRYGCVPVVARTGGLADTIIDANEAALSAGVATGFQHGPDSLDELLYGARRAMAAYAQPKRWQALQRAGMKADVSWTQSGARYAEIYSSLTKA